MGNAFNNAGLFLVQVFFSLYIYIVLLRLVFQVLKINFYNPISHMILQVTNPIISPLQSYIPRLYNVDLATVLVLFLLELIKLSLIFMLTAGALPHFAALLVVSLAELISDLINLFFYAILIMIILSWVNPNPNPLTTILFRITEPIMRPARRIIPPVAGFDISPIPVMIGLKVLAILLVQPLMAVIS